MRRVVKLGGSLLMLPQLSERLRAWLDDEPARQTVVIVGGGAPVETLREISAAQKLDDEAAHWLAIEAMRLTLHSVAALVPELPLVAEFAALRDQDGVVLFDVRQFMTDVEPHAPGTKLPASWDVTSDAIAARLAVVLGADELVLLKSQSPASADVAALAAAGYVDAFLPKLAAELPPLRCVNLRGA